MPNFAIKYSAVNSIVEFGNRDSKTFPKHFNVNFFIEVSQS